MIFSSLLTLYKVVGNVVKAKGLVISKHWKLVVAPSGEFTESPDLISWNPTKKIV
jgi:hypothetical protein